MNGLTAGIIAAAIIARDLIKAALTWRATTLKHRATMRQEANQ